MALPEQYTNGLDRHPFRHALAVTLFFTAFYVLLFSPLLATGRPLALHETLLFFWPAFFAKRTAWTELLFAGFPLMGDPQTMMWYPLSLFFALFRAWNAFVLSAYVLAASFTYGYVYTLTRQRFASLVSGITYGMSGYFIVRLVHTNMIHAAAWLPLLIWSLEMQRRRASWKWAAITSVAVACGGLAGHPQIWAYSLGTAGLYALTIASGCPAGWRSFFTKSLIGVVIGVGLTGILLVPMVELAGNSVRAEITPQYAVSYSLTPSWLPLLLFPLLSTDLSFSSALRFPWLEVTGYVGFLSIALAAVALLEQRKNRLVLFWFAVSVIAVLFVLGASTPFGRLSFIIPIYNKFRAPGRHIVEFAFAFSLLAGCGMASLLEMPLAKRLQSVRRVLTCLAAVTLTLAIVLARTENRGVVILPCVILSLTVLSLWFWSKKPTHARSLLLVAALVLDLGQLGYFVIRPAVLFDSLNPKKADYLATLEQTAAASQQRIAPLRAAEISMDAAPPNLSRFWQLPSAGGYNPLVLRRYAELAGIASEGRFYYPSLDSANRSLDLLGLRYLLVPNLLLTGAWQFERLGIGWRYDDLEVQLGSGCGSVKPQSISFNLPDVEATAVGITSSLSCSLSLEDKSDVLKITATGKDGMTQTVFLKTGTHTSEWAWERKDVRGTVRHSMAPVFDSYPSVDSHDKGFEGHHYAGILSLPRTQVRNLRLDWAGSAGMVSLQRVSLKDDITRRSYALTREADYLLDAHRWQPAGGFGETKVFENRRAMPRVWIASKTIALSPQEILETIHTSRLPDGTEYDPREVALTETRVDVDSHSDPSGSATIRSANESEVQVRTHSREPGFLVLSNVDYPGWEATVDGASTPIVRTDYALRGVRLPPGDHTVDFVFRPNSFRLGLILTAFSALGLAMVLARGLFAPKLPS